MEVGLDSENRRSTTLFFLVNDSYLDTLFFLNDSCSEIHVHPSRPPCYQDPQNINPNRDLKSTQQTFRYIELIALLAPLSLVARMQLPTTQAGPQLVCGTTQSFLLYDCRYWLKPPLLTTLNDEKIPVLAHVLSQTLTCPAGFVQSAPWKRPTMAALETAVKVAAMITEDLKLESIVEVLLILRDLRCCL